MELVVNDRTYTLGPKIRMGQAFHVPWRNQGNLLPITDLAVTVNLEAAQSGPLLSGFYALTTSPPVVQRVHGVLPHFREAGHDPVPGPLPRGSRGRHHRPVAVVLVSPGGVNAQLRGEHPDQLPHYTA